MNLNFSPITFQQIENQEDFNGLDVNQQDIAQMSIQFEYKLIQIYGPILGTYCLPNLQVPLIWNCLIFIHHGYYKDAKFKFDLDLTDFPSKIPKVIFQTKIFHPFINSITGQLDLQNLLNEKWKYGHKNILYNIFKSIQRMFVDVKKIKYNKSVNREAWELLQEQRNCHLFIEKAYKSVEDSKQELYENSEGSCLLVKNYKDKELLELKEQIKNICQSEELNFEMKKQQLIKYVLGVGLQI